MLKVPPFRRKPESLSPQGAKFPSPPDVPFLRRQESPRRRRKLSPKAVQFPAASLRRRFLPSQEWDGVVQEWTGEGMELRDENGIFGEIFAKNSPRKKKSQKKVENADFFSPFSDKIGFLLHFKENPDENHCPPPPRDSLILRVFRVLAVLLAAILGTAAANAQEAMARVYKQPADTNILGASFSPRDTLVDIVSSILGGAASSANLPNFIIIAAPAGVGFTVLETPGGNGLPVREPPPDVPDPRAGPETRACDFIII
ncbi:MAG: hypothetical protein ACR2QC_06250, partial [Gammaproteobacteria bacterium]